MNRRLSEAEFVSLLEAQPVIAAVKHMDALRQAIESDVAVVFVLFGDILTIPEIVAELKEAGKAVIAHIDLIEGFSNRDVSVRFMAERTQVDGILSTRTNLIREAHQRGLISVQRLFLLDSLALDNIKKQGMSSDATALEILPGIMPRVISEVASILQRPLIAGGLIRDDEDAVAALNAGAMAISTTKASLWN